MLFNKYLAVYGTIVCISILLTSCATSNLKGIQTPIEATAADVRPPTCGDSLNYYSQLAARANDEPSTANTNTIPVENSTDVCLKLREAIRLSMPGSEQQSDKEALVLLQDLKRTDVLSGSNLQFNNMLLEHVSQRQYLHKTLDAQQKRLIKVETQNTILRNQLKTLQSQLEQLKNIDVEIDKKERKVSSPVNE